MAKNDALKKRLKQSAKRRAKRASAAEQVTSSAGMQAAAASSQVESSGQAAALDRFISAVLAFDREHQGVRDRDLMTALRSMQRGYAPTDQTCSELYARLVASKQGLAAGTHAVRKALDQLIELVKSYDAGAKEPRSALNYLHSIAS